MIPDIDGVPLVNCTTHFNSDFPLVTSDGTRNCSNLNTSESDEIGSDSLCRHDDDQLPCMVNASPSAPSSAHSRPMDFDDIDGLPMDSDLSSTAYGTKSTLDIPDLPEDQYDHYPTLASSKYALKFNHIDGLPMDTDTGSTLNLDTDADSSQHMDIDTSYNVPHNMIKRINSDTEYNSESSLSSRSRSDSAFYYLNHLDGIPMDMDFSSRLPLNTDSCSSPHSLITRDIVNYGHPSEVTTFSHPSPLSQPHAVTIGLDHLPKDSNNRTTFIPADLRCSQASPLSLSPTSYSADASPVIPLSSPVSHLPLASSSSASIYHQKAAQDRIASTIHLARIRSDIPASIPSSFTFNCYQLNLHRSLAPLDNLQFSIAESTSTDPWICFVQEPPVNKSLRLTAISKDFCSVVAENDSTRPRAAIIYSSFLNTCSTPLVQFTNRDISTLRIHTGPSTPDLIVCSFYWDYNVSQINSSLLQMCGYASFNNLALVMGGDTNAHHTAWGSSNINKRGEKLMELILDHDLSILNDGSITFQNSLRCEALDVTLCNQAAIDLIESWHTSSSPSLSDHSLISFSIKNSNNHLERPTGTSTKRRSRRLLKTEESTFTDHLDDMLTTYSKSLSVPCNSPSELNDKVDLINSILFKAHKVSTSNHYVSVKQLARKVTSPWWNKQLRLARRKVRSAWNRWSRTGALTDRSAYRKLKNKYNRLIRRTKNTSWTKFCSNLSSSQHRVSTVLKRLGNKKASLSSIINHDGSYTQSALETLSVITDKDNMSSSPPADLSLFPAVPSS